MLFQKLHIKCSIHRLFIQYFKVYGMIVKNNINKPTLYHEYHNKKNISLFIILSLLCSIANADFTDQIQNIGLYHCDSTNVTAYHKQTLDDNSSSRVSNPLMELRNPLQ